ADHRPLAWGLHTGCGDDPKTGHLRPGRPAAWRLSHGSIRCGRQLHHRAWFFRGQPTGHGRGAGICRRRQGQGGYRAPAAVGHQSSLRAIGKGRCGGESRDRFQAEL
ncbi:Alcohol dehydrogenase (EC 1.1.1.1), partial [Pseudomonas sp. FEN]